MGARERKDTAAFSPYESAAVFEFVQFTIGAKVSNAINVAMKLQNANAAQIGFPAQFQAYLSDNPDGSTLTATTPSGGVAIGTNGLILNPEIAGKMFSLISKSDGTIDLTITHASPHNFYLVVMNPLGFLTVSPIIAF